ncbi:MAG: helix-hairpin-helix domain-containing protein [Candidatus Cloacimonetes bacterium]|nr:helix-hairpin-helix domain-containing protein [Candidatus Cloacimonadota bacterium]
MISIISKIKNMFTRTERKVFFWYCILAIFGLLLAQTHMVFADMAISHEVSLLKEEIKNDIILRFDLNMATHEELKTIKGIGDKKAADIIEYRNKNKYMQLEDLLNVKGIGVKTLQNISPFLYINKDDEKVVVDSTNSKILKVKKLDEGDKKINILTASVEELMMIKGIGKVKAKQIVDYRSDNKIDSFEDLLNIKGIGPKLLEIIIQHSVIDDSDQIIAADTN